MLYCLFRHAAAQSVRALRRPCRASGSSSGAPPPPDSRRRPADRRAARAPDRREGALAVAAGDRRRRRRRLRLLRHDARRRDHHRAVPLRDRRRHGRRGHRRRRSSTRPRRNARQGPAMRASAASVGSSAFAKASADTAEAFARRARGEAPRIRIECPGREQHARAHHFDRRVPRLRHVPHARGSDAAVDAARRLPRQPFLGDRRLQHRARAVAGMLAPRPHPAGVLVPGRRGAAVLDRQPPGPRAALRADAAARRLAQRGADPPRHLPPLAGRSRTYWTFEDTLTQIGLGYTVLFLLAFAPLRAQAIAFAAILVGFWAAFVLYPLPRARLRLHAGRRPRELAASVHGLPRALQQELESRVGVRRLVPEPVPAREAVPLQRRRLVDAELHPDAGDDDAGPVVRRVAEIGAPGERQAEGAGGRGRGARLGRPRAAVAAHQPDREADLDLVVHAV